VETIQQKICLLGDFGVGKTSLVRRFVSGIFDDKYLSTVGVNISRKAVTLNTNTKVVTFNFMLWDLNGGAKFDKMFTSYCGGASGALIVCDLGRAETFDKLSYYAEGFKQLRPTAPLLIVGNKNDLPSAEWRVNPTTISTLAQKYSAASFLTSAKTGAIVNEMFDHLAHLLLTMRVQ
jgi:small GTP-binding protein